MLGVKMAALRVVAPQHRLSSQKKANSSVRQLGHLGKSACAHCLVFFYLSMNTNAYMGKIVIEF